MSEVKPFSLAECTGSEIKINIYLVKLHENDLAKDLKNIFFTILRNYNDRSVWQNWMALKLK